MILNELFYRPAEPLLEGGNMFADVESFQHEKIPAIMQAVNNVLSGASARAIPIGSGATPTPGKVSGDLDIIVDQDALSKTFNITDPKLIRKKLRAMFDEAGLETGQSGVSVHVRVPTGGAAHQVDIMVVPRGENAAKFHTHNIPAGSPYKGANKQITMAILAKKRGLLWSPYQGLFKRDAEGKKGAFATDDIDEVAQMLLGKDATGADLGSVESILAKLPPMEAATFMDELKSDPAWPVVKESVSGWGSAAPGKIIATKNNQPLNLDFPTVPGDAGMHHFDQALRRFQGTLGLTELNRINIARELVAGRNVTVNGITFGVARRKPQEMR